MGKCCLCGKTIEGFGNNPSPLNGSLCCDSCDANVVLPLRIFLTGANKNQIMILNAENNTITYEDVKDQLSLERMQKIVDGYVEVVPVQDKYFYYLVNEEGLLYGLPQNKLAEQLFSLYIVGNMIVCPKCLLK